MQRLGRSKGRKAQNLIYLGIGTGLGGGIIANGEIYHGRETAGELGHITINYNGPKCTCGGNGCLEVYASIRGWFQYPENFTKKELTRLSCTKKP